MDNRAAILALLKETTRRIELMDKQSLLVPILLAAQGAYISCREHVMLEYLAPHIASELTFCKKMAGSG